jgi:uncharacterized membrane protein (UPF0136 family)
MEASAAPSNVMYSRLTQFEFLREVAGFLVGFYLVAVLINVVAATANWRRGRKIEALVWSIVAVLFGVFAIIAFNGRPELVGLLSLPRWFRDAANLLLSGRQGPIIFTLGSAATLTVMFVFRRFFVRPVVALAGMNIALLLFGFAVTDRHFADIVGKPDNIAIVGMLFLFAYVTWLATHKAVINDERHKRGEPPLEKLDDEEVLVWPDLIYVELIVVVLVTASIIAWAILVRAPLEGPADIANTPNPSKAPWYFSGLQEMLLYFDPWYAGVVAPTLIILGLCAIPYLDVNKEGSGYYTIERRKFAYIVFQSGFFMWVGLIVIAVFFRGPNWSFFGPFEAWDTQRLPNLQHVTLAEAFWNSWLGRAQPSVPAEAGAFTTFGQILLRELPGLLVMAILLVGVPITLAKTCMKRFRADMGRLRFTVMIIMLVLMMLFPVKMILIWAFDLRAIVSMPEYMFRF